MTLDVMHRVLVAVVATLMDVDGDTLNLRSAFTQ